MRCNENILNDMIFVHVKVSLLAPPEVSFHYELSFFKSGNTSVNVQPGGKVKSISTIRSACNSFIIPKIRDHRGAI